jgi:hypothetical protein
MPLGYQDENITVEDLTNNTDAGNFLISAANALPNQSGIINALPNIMSPGVTTIENQAMRNFDQPYNMRDVAGESLPFNIDNLGNPNNDPRVVSEELGMTGYGKPTMADVAGGMPGGDRSYFDLSDPFEGRAYEYFNNIDRFSNSVGPVPPTQTMYEDLIMNPENNPNRLQNLERNIDIDNEEFEEIPGFNFIDAPTSLGSRLKNLQYINNPRRGFIDNTLLARGNPNAGLINKGKKGLESLLSRIPTPFNLARGFLDAVTGPRRETTGTVYSDSGRAYSPSELNKMNAKGGYYSEPAREQRRREKRVENMLARKAAGKSYSQKNLNKLTTGGSKPGTYTAPGSGNAGSSSGGKSIVCTAMYQTTGLQDWKKAMKIWYVYQKKHLTDTHQEGYHWLFKPFVKAMKKSKIVEALGAHVAKHRTQELKHILFNSKSDKLGKVYNLILEPICFIAGKIKSVLGRG